jgi:predicted RNase H-like nuclease (RuvC/YqgF family)
MADPNKSMDDIIKKVAGDPEPEEVKDENQDPEDKPEDNEDQDIETPEENDDNDDNDEASKQNAAFAKMRIENKELKSQIAKLTEDLKSVNKNLDDPKADKKDIEENKEEKKDLEARLKEVEDRLNETSKELEEERNLKKRQIAISELNSLKTEYELSPNDLVQFAEDAEKQGYSLADNPEKIRDVYRTIYMNQIIEKEVAKKLKEANIAGNPPGITGPKGQVKSNQGTGSTEDIIKRISKKLK